MPTEVQINILPGGCVDRKNAARALNRAPKTLAEWARMNIGPTPFKVHGRVLYHWADVQAFGTGTAAANDG